MRKLSMALSVLGLMWLMTGCSASLQPEHQAYVISMSAEHTEGEKLRIGITVPTSSGGGSGGEGGGEGAKYSKMYATTNSFSEAIDVLQTTAPYALNLSQMQSIIISRELAESADFPTLLDNIMMTNHLFSDTRIVICEGSAKTFMENEKPQLGGQLSVELETSYQHYTQRGYVPNSRLSDIYYTCASFYGDALCMLAATDSGGGSGANGSDASGEAPSGSGGASEAVASGNDHFGDVPPSGIPVEGPGKNHYLGSAVIKGFRMIGQLNGAQTRWVQVVDGSLTSFYMIIEGDPVRLKVHGHPKIQIDSSGDVPKISIELRIQPVPLRKMPADSKVIEHILSEINGMLKAICALGADPVGFGEIAAMQFLTVDDFRHYAWTERLKQAEFDVKITIVRAYQL